MLKKFIKGASQQKIQSGRFFELSKFLLQIIWIGGLIVIAKPVYEMFEAIPTYMESSRLKDDPEYLAEQEKLQSESRLREHANGDYSPKHISYMPGILPLGKYDAGFKYGYTNQHAVRASNAWGYIETGIVFIFFYLLAAFVVPFFLIRVVSILFY